MKVSKGLSRFLEAQEETFKTALSEVKKGKKQTHWMWYIFPQILGLGQSQTSKFYAIQDKAEAKAYLHHAVLGERLKEISRALLDLQTSDAHKIFGSPDDLKLKSSMTLFLMVSNKETVFKSVLEKFFQGEHDAKTLQILSGYT